MNDIPLSSLLFAGSPFQFHVDAANSGYVYAYGPGLTHGMSGQPSPFTIVTKDAGAGMYQVYSLYEKNILNQ